MPEAVIQVRGDLSDITEKFAQLRGQMQALDSQTASPAAALSERFKSIGTTIAGVGAVVSAVGATFGAFGIAAAKGAGHSAEQLDMLAQKTGLTTDQLRQLTPIFNRFNTDLSALSQPFRLLSKNFEDAAAGSEKAKAKFQDLGIEISATDRPIDVLHKVANAAKELGPGFERNAAMAALMGRGIATLVPILAEGSEGMKRSAEDAQRMGLMLGAVTEGQLKDMDDAFDDLGTVSKAFRDTLGTAFAPVLLQLAQALTATIGVFNNWFQGLDTGTKNLVVVFTGVFAIGGPILVAVGAFMAALAVITAPMLVAGAIVAGVVAALTLIVVYWQNLKALGTTLWSGLTTTIVGSARAIYDGIMEWLVNRTEAIASKVQGFAVKLAAPFEWLADHLVGHSVIPDMVKDIGDHMSLLDTRMGSPARIATTNTLQMFRGFQLSVDRIFGEFASVAVSTWGNVTNTLSGALSKNITQGNAWAQTWKTIQDTVLQGFINLGLQLVTQGAITLAKKLLLDENEATAHEATEAAKTAATTTGETARLLVAISTSEAMKVVVFASLSSMSAVATAALGIALAVSQVVAGIAYGAAAIMAATPFGQPAAGALIVATTGFEIATGASLILAEGLIQGALGAAIVANSLPAFANGGAVFGPTLALVGENASFTNPEYIGHANQLGLGGSQTIVTKVYLDGRQIATAIGGQLGKQARLQGAFA